MQAFARWTNLGFRAALVAIAAAPPLIVAIGWFFYFSSWKTGAGEPVEQPVPFSHEHHVSGDGIDCRYCHTSVEESAFAGIPSIHTCMSCHSQLFTDSPMLEPVRKAYRSGIPIQWVRVNDLPDFVYFDHSIHVAKGVGCSECHGRIDQMPMTWKARSLYMRWCLDCHTAPEKYLRPRSEIFNMSWTRPANQIEMGRALVRAYRIEVKNLNDCVMCHR